MSDGLDELDQGWFSDQITQADAQMVDARERARVREAVATYEREIAASVDPRRRAVLSYEIGRIFDEILRDEHAAIRAYQRAHRADPTHRPTLMAVARLFGQAGRWAMVLRMVDAALRATRVPDERARLLCEKGDIFFLRFHRFEQAQASYEAALKLNATSTAALRGLAEVCMALGTEDAVDALLALANRVDAPKASRGLRLEAASRLAESSPAAAASLLDANQRSGAVLPTGWGVVPQLPGDRALSTALEQVAAVTGGVEDRARLLLEAAQRQVDGDPDRALDLARQATALDPSSILAWDTVIDLERRSEHWAAMAEALEESISAADTALDHVERLWRLSEVQLKHLDDPDSAVISLKALLAIEPAWPPAAERLERLLASHGAWADVVLLREAALARMEEPHRQADALFRIGLIYERQLEDAQGAQLVYRRALEARPDFHDAGKALGRLLIAQGDWAGYTTLVEAEVNRASELDVRLQLLTRISEVAEEHLNDLDRAIAACQRILEFAPDHLLTMRRTARLLARCGRWAQLLEINDLELERLNDVGLILSLLVRSSEICDVQLGDTEQATAYLQRAMLLAPRYVPAVESLAALYQRTGEWGALVALLRRQAKLTADSAERVALLFRVSEIFRGRMGDEEGALQAMVEALEAAPDHLPTLRALRGLYRERGDAQHERRLLGEELLRVDMPDLRADLLYRVGVLNQRVGEPDEAVEAWEQALAARPEHMGAAMALLDALSVRGDESAVRALRRRLAGLSVPAEALMHWGEVLRSARRDVEAEAEAREACEAILALEPKHMAALLTMVGLQAAGDEPAALIDTYHGLAEAVGTPSLKAEYLARAAQIRMTALDDGPGALQDYQAVLGSEPDHREALDFVERWAARTGDVELLASVLERRLAVAGSERGRQMVLVRAGDTLWRAQRLEDATHCFEAVLEMDPESIVALRALRALYHDLGQSGAATRLTEAEGRKSLDTHNAVRLLLQAGAVHESESRDASAALADYRAALAREPHDDGALRAVRRVTEKTARWRDLAETLLSVAESRPDQRSELLLEAAQIYARRLSRVDEAVRVLQDLARSPEVSTYVLQQLADYLVELEAWDLAVSVYAQVVERSDDPELRRAVSLRVATIHEGKRDDLGAAQAWLELVIEDGPPEVALFERVARVRSAQGDVDGAREALRTALPLANRTPAVDRRLRLALAEGAEPVELINLLRIIDVTEQGGQSERIAALLVGACTQLKKPRLLVSLLAPSVAHAHGQRAKRLRRLMVDGALAAGEHPGSLRVDIELLIEADPDDVALRRLHITALGRGLDAPDRMAAGYRWLLHRDPFASDDLRGLRRLSERTGVVDRAYEMARLLIALGEGGEDDQALVEACQSKVKRWPQRPLNELDRRLIWGGGVGDLAQMLSHLASVLPGVFNQVIPTGTEVEGPVVERAKRLGALIGCPIDSVQAADRGTQQIFVREGVLYVGEPLLALNATAQCFVLGTGLELAVRGLDWITAWSPTALGGLLEALASLGAHPPPMGASSPETREARAASLSARFKDIRADIQPDLDALGARLVTTEASRFRVEIFNAAQRTGLLAAGGVSPAVEALCRLHETPVSPRRAPGLAGLIRWVVGDAYYTTRRRLGLAAQR
jgi:cellulose synthase operon protein C